MTTEVMKRPEGGALAAAAALKANLAKVRAALPAAGNKGYLRFLQDGNWVFGQENTELEKEVEVAINPMSIKVGFSSWTDYDKKEKRKNELVGEVLVPLGADVPAKHTMKDTGWDWREQIVVDVKVLSGKHRGKELVFSTTSVGGTKMLNGIIEQIMSQLDVEPDYMVPVIALKSDWYPHKQWGKTYTPDYDLVEFISMDGMANDGIEEPEVAPAPEPQTQRTTRARAPEPEPEQEIEEAEVVEQAAPADTAVRRRRR